MGLGPGVAVGQNLRLVRLLARGGMGSVWVADHLGLKTTVAVKFIDESLGADPGVLGRFTREAAAAAQIRSPHVVQIFDHGFTEERVPYIVMELLEGESLGARIQRLGVLSLEETGTIVSHVCKALGKAHALGVVHRDIKPDNIFLTDSDGDLFVKVLDFGIAKRKGDEVFAATSTGVAVGTPHYMSPEQLMSAKDAIPATDLWAVAIATYRGLTGELPFDHETFPGLCIAITNGVFRPPREHRSNLPVSLDNWFKKALAVKPQDRFGSARELAESFSMAAGLSANRLHVPSALSPSVPSSNGRLEPSNPTTDPGTSTAAVSPEFDSARLLVTPSTGKRAFGSGGSGASIAGASIPANALQPRPRSRAPLFAAGAVVASIAVVAFVLSSRGPSPVPVASASAPSAAHAETVPAATAPAIPSAAPTAPSVEPAETVAPEPVRPTEEPLPPPSYSSRVESRPHAAPHRPRGTPPVGSAPHPAAPAPTPKQETDYGF
jgi:serine/threonine-protein kinase